MRIFPRLILASAVLALIAGPAAFAQEANDDPSSKGTTGLFVVPRASTLRAGSFAIGGHYLALDQEEGDTTVQTTGAAASFALAVSDNLEFFGSFEPHLGVERDFTVQRRVGAPRSLASPVNDHPFGVDSWSEGVGDLRLGVKARLAGDPEEYSGVAVAGEVKLPTANDEEGVGTGEFDFTPMVIGSYEANETVGFNAFAGLELKGDPDEIDVLNEFHWGAGVQVPTRFWLQGIFEVFGTRLLDVADFGPTVVGAQGLEENVTYVQAGVRLSHETGLSLALAGNFNITAEGDDLEDSAGDFFAQVAYSRSRREPVVFEGTSPASLPPVNRPPTLSCRAERDTIRTGESVRIMATVSDPDGDDVTVTWTPPAGTIDPRQGETVTWSSEGVQPGTGIIRGRADDGYGGTSDTCEVRVTVEEPPPPPEPTVLDYMCSEFPSGSTRIDNRCKAILDDVALQLRQNPRATAVITGYSDDRGSEDINMETSQERADNGRTYLVETHGIDAGRIETRGAGPADPIADNATAEGRSQNRRIEIVVTIPPE